MTRNNDIKLETSRFDGDLYFASRGSCPLGRIYRNDNGLLYARRHNDLVSESFASINDAVIYLGNGRRHIPGFAAARSVIFAAVPKPHIIFRSTVLLLVSACCYTMAPILGSWASTAGLVALVVAVNQLLATSVLLGIDDAYRIVANRFGLPSKETGGEL